MKIQLNEDNPNEIIRLIDKNNSGFITYDTLSTFFRNYNLFLEEEIIIIFLKKISNNDELKITKRDFVQFLKPYYDENHFSNKNSRQIKRVPLKNIENYNVNLKNEPNNIKNKLKSSKKVPDNSNNTLRLETADFQYTENHDDGKSMDSFYESPIYKTHSFSRNFNLPSINLETQGSLLELKNDLMNDENSKILNSKTTVKDDYETDDNEIQKIRRKYSFYPQEETRENTPNFHNFKKKRSNGDEIIGFFDNLISLRKKNEKMKQDLALRPDFNVLDFFVLFDKNQKGYLNFEELESMFSELKIRASFTEICLFLRKYDQSDSGEMRFALQNISFKLV